jgi:ATP-dependent exoDNAse (exonuclease V) beta subunit
MTIHKAKGLEFDCVILPSLGSKTSNTNKPLLRWLTLPTCSQEPLVLISPLQASHEAKCPLYDYLGKLNQEKEKYEQQRLLYVAVTRAKKRLYLTDYHASNTQGTFRSLFQEESFEAIEAVKQETEALIKSTKLQHLPIQFYETESHLWMPSLTPTHTVAVFTDSFARLLGIAAHELLQWICTYHPEKKTDIPWDFALYTLKQHGLNSNQMNTALSRLKEYILPLFDTPRGRWIISAHQDEQNEYELLIQKEHDVHTRIIDRTFYDNQVRWIIDFKTGREDSLNEQKHRAQVNEYATLLAPMTNTSIHCGLYYLTTHHWVEWESVLS